MSMKNWWKRAVIGGIAALTVAAGLTAATVPTFAQTDDAGANPPPSGIMGRQQGPLDRQGGFMHGDRGKHAAALAEALGITVDELEAAQAAVRAAALAEAVATGAISQEQADLMQAGAALRTVIDREALLAEALGISVDELTAARADGTLRGLMVAADRATLQESMQRAMQTAVDQAVADGVITQAQADLLSEAHSEFEHGEFGRGGFGRGGFERGGHDRGERGEGQSRGGRFGTPDSDSGTDEGSEGL